MRQYPRDAFTLIELLIVIAIIATLASIILAIVPAVQAEMRRATTRNAINGATMAIEVAASDGAPIAPAVHPLAGSAEPAGIGTGNRPRFVRANGSSVSTSGLAYRAESIEHVLASSQANVLLDSDHFSGVYDEGDLPFLHGLPRRSVGIIGAGNQLTTCYQTIPAPSQIDHDGDGVPEYRGGRYDRDQDGVTDGPYTDANRYPPRQLRQAPDVGDGIEGAQADALSHALAGSVYEELVAAGSVIDSRQILNGDGAFLADDRVWHADEGDQSDTYVPGRLAIGSNWYAYRIRGPALYDAWGRELLYGMTDQGAIRIMSAGPDGVFRFDPGNNATLDTGATAETPEGDDLAGWTDNLQTVEE